MSSAYPLAVDMDGTLLRCDSLDEAWRIMLIRRPLLLILLMFVSLWRGWPYFKWHLYAALADLPFHTDLPVNTALVDWLRTQRASGRKLILISATPAPFVGRVAALFGDLFTTSVGSPPDANLRSHAKAAYLVAHYGQAGYDYVGNSSADIAVWAQARMSYTVNPYRGLFSGATAAGVAGLTLIAPWRADTLRAYYQALRPSQWLKNLLIVVPLVAAHRLTDFSSWGTLLFLFIVLCALASAGYLFNDFRDLHSDRLDPAKRRRPLASGALSTFAGWHTMWVLLLLGGLGAFALWGSMGWLVVGYAFLSFGYTIFLKLIPILDLLALSAMYVYRMMLGGWLTGVPLSNYFLAAGFSFFIQLAILKRIAQVIRLSGAPATATARRPYTVSNLGLLTFLWGLSLIALLLVLFIYPFGYNASLYYTHPLYLLLIPVAVAIWSLLAFRRFRLGAVHDPLTYALRTPSSLGVLFVIILSILLSL